MSDPSNSSKAPFESGSGSGGQVSGEQPQQSFLTQHHWRFVMIVSVIMVLLALLGVALSTSANPATARKYWAWLVPVFGVLCVITAWVRAQRSHSFSWLMVIRQILHWLVIAGALGLDFYVRGSGEETGGATGLNALLLLALGCLLAGVHLEWHFALVGLLLMLTLVCVAKAEQYLWMIFLLGGVIIVVMIVIMKMLGAARSPERVARTPA